MNRWKASIILFTVLFIFNILVGILIAFLIHGQGPDCVKVRAKRGLLLSSPNQTQVFQCEHDTTLFTKPPTVFDSLTVDELQRLRSFLRQKGLISGSTFQQRSNALLAVSIYPFDKREVDTHLEQVRLGNTDAKVPDRYAFVRLRRGARNPPDIMEYKIGPLAAGANIKSQRLTENLEIPFNARTNDLGEFYVHRARFDRELWPLAKLFSESFDGGTMSGGLSTRVMDPPGVELNDRTRRYSVNFQVPGTWLGYDLHPTPVAFSFNSTDTNTNRWNTHSYYYLNQGPYNSAYDLAEAYDQGQIRKIKVDKGLRSRLNGRVYPHEHRGKQRLNADKQPPRSYEPQGPRYEISNECISWMGWEFVINIDYIRGPVLRDVRFKGERILWELALSEVALVYAHDSSTGNNILADTSFNLAAQIARGIFNVECPEHGTFMNSTIIDSNLNKRTYPTTCVFEADAERPLWRMRDQKFAAGMRESYLVVR